MSRPQLAFLIKFVIAASLLLFLAKRYDLGGVLPSLTIHSPAWLLGALLALFAGQFCSAWRWTIIIRAAEVPVSAWQAVRLSFVGVFFNATLPSVVGGDAVRIWELTRLGVSMMTSVASVFADRISGLFGLVLLILLTLPLMLTLADNSLALGAGIGAAAAAMTYVSTMRWADRIRLGSLEASKVLRLARRVRGMLVPGGGQFGISVLSTLSQLSAPIAVFALARSFSFELGLGACLAFIPLVTLVTLLPIAIGGWGLREGAVIAAMSQVGMPAQQSLVLSIAFGISLVVLGLPGGIFWFFGSHKQRVSLDG